MKADGGFLRPPHASAIHTPGCDGRPRKHNDLEGIAGTGETPVSHPNTDKKTASATAPRFTSLDGGADCAGCAFRDHQIDLLSRSLGTQAEAAAVMSARMHAAESELGRRVAAERRTAEFLTGLAALQRVEAAG